MREGNKKTRNALKYLIHWKVVNLTQPSKRSISSEQSPAERSRAVNYDGIGAIHLMGQIGLAEEINARVVLLKRHLPYQESDHVLNLVYNALLDGLRLEDIELRRNGEASLYDL